MVRIGLVGNSYIVKTGDDKFHCLVTKKGQIHIEQTLNLAKDDGTIFANLLNVAQLLVNLINNKKDEVRIYINDENSVYKTMGGAELYDIMIGRKNIIDENDIYEPIGYSYNGDILIVKCKKVVW